MKGLHRSRTPTALDIDDGNDVTTPVTAVVLVALSAVVEVVGHELVGHRHTVRVVERSPVEQS